VRPYSVAEERSEIAVGRLADTRSEPARSVLTCAMRGTPSTRRHEASTRAEIARRLARLLQCEYVGEYDPPAPYDGRPSFVPGATLTSAVAASLGICSADDLFGGVVPADFVATKTI